MNESPQTPIPDLVDQVDLDKIESDFAGVEAALDRLENDTYWTCEVTGQPIPIELLAKEPTRRRR